jgi:2'-5' RNA ligase
MLNADMRTFVALDLDADIRERIRNFMDGVRSLAPDVRWVSAESLHVTLKFIGEIPDAKVLQIKEALGSIQSEPFQLRFGGAGFFPSAKAARVFWIGIEAGSGLVELATMVDESLTAIGIPKENRSFNPHLTLARAGGGSGAPGWRKGDRPNRQFAKLQEFLDKHPTADFGTMSAREFFLYCSQLSNKGARYTKIARFDLASATN